MNDTGIVYLVGAGPGDPELITVRGLRCLRRADVVIYDRLVSDSLLDEAPQGAERIFAGKLPGCHALQQVEINALMIERAKLGQTVVRLKGGDPFVFGRGGEEALACAAAGVQCDIVPGITSAVAVPGCAGIPVTHRGLSGTFAVVTAHRAGSPAVDGGHATSLHDGLDWSALARIDTLVILMGVERLPYVVAMLIDNRRPPETPVAIIERGTLPNERTVTGTLASILLIAREVQIASPAVIVVGDVVRVREMLIAGPELVGAESATSALQTEDGALMAAGRPSSRR